MNRKPPANKIVAKLTEAQLAELKEKEHSRGYDEALANYRGDKETLARQKEQLAIDQTRAVTELIRATTENLSKAGYLIGKLNNDKSR